MAGQKLEPNDPALAPLPTGPAAAATLATGIGTAAYGLLVILVEMFPGFKTAMTLNQGVGPLAGKTTFAVLIYFIAWAVLARVYKDKDVEFGKIWKVSLALIIAGFVLTFPPVYEMFTAH